MSDGLLLRAPAGLPIPAAAGSPPERPRGWRERLSSRLFRALAPRLGRQRPPRTPRRLAPSTGVEIDRRRGPGRLAGRWYPAAGEARGAVLLAPPWVKWGQAWFHRHGRIEALRAAGYHAMTFDFGGVGRSGPPDSFYDADVEDALAALKARSDGLPVHFWGVSFGGYWAHPALGRAGGVSGAVFEDVAAHLIEWSKRIQPLGYPAYLVFQHGFPAAYRYLDLRRHAAHLGVAAAVYVSGERDRGVWPEETRDLARRAGGEALVIPGADHLESNKLAGERVAAAALAAFAAANRSGQVAGSIHDPD